MPLIKEIGFAVDLGKPVLGYRDGFRLSADNESSQENLHNNILSKCIRGKIIHELKDIQKELKVTFGLSKPLFEFVFSKK